MEPFIGQIQAFGFNFAPRGWAKCDGSLLPISQHSALFSLLGTTYGGDGRTTFGLPDLRGRAALHQGTGPGLSPRTIGQRGGQETSTLTTQNLPPHNHSLHARGEEDNSEKPENNVLAASPTYSTAAQDVTMHGTSIGNTGSSQAFNNMQPFLVINWCIALVGTFPSRN
jgi:microcystin-dependent protein